MLMVINIIDSEFFNDEFSPDSQFYPEERSLPADVFKIDSLTWGWPGEANIKLTGDVIYSPMLQVETVCSMEILCANSVVYFKGQPCSAYIFHCVDRKTQEVCARRLIRDLPLMPKMKEGDLFLHRPRGDVTVLTADWDSRKLISSSIFRCLTRTMNSDPSFSRIVTRGSMGKSRVDYDTAILNKFITQPFGMMSHLRSPYVIDYRFSDFNFKSQINFGYGVTYELKFDEPEVAVIAEDWIDRIKDAISKSSSTNPDDSIKIFNLSKECRQIFEFNDTSLIWNKPCITLTARFNSYQTRLCMSLVLACICGLWSDSNLLNKFNLKNIDI